MAVSNYNPIKDIPDLRGRVYFITGGTAGLGAGAIANLATHNPAHIYFSGRSTAKANELIQKIQRDHPSTPITFVECDLTSLNSVQAAAKQFLDQSDRLDVLMCNAGIMAVDASTSKDGYEIQWQVNHLAHALLIKELLPLMQKTTAEPGADVRIINMSSIAYQQAPKQGIDFAGLKTDQRSLGGIIPGPKWSRYGQSKLANMLYPEELAKRYPDITSVSVHPGYILTDLFSNVSLATKLPVLIMSIGKTTPVEQGPYNQIWASTCPKSLLKNGEYYEPIGRVGKRTTKQARDSKLAEQLWDWTEKVLEKY